MLSVVKRHFAITVIVLVGFVLFGVIHAMNIIDIKLPMSGDWKERFQDVTKLNDYAKTHPVELSNVKIENSRIDGAVINAGQFKSTDWKMVNAQKSRLTNVVFREGLLEGVNFSDSIITDVIFEDVTLEEVRFVNSTLKNVKFIHCTLNGVNIDQTKQSNIEISRSRVINTSLSDGQLTAVIKNSILTKKTSLTDLQPPSSLYFEKSELDHVDMSRSILEELKLESIKSQKSGFNGGSIDKVQIYGDSISFGLSEMKIGQIIIEKVNQIGLAFDDTAIQSLTFRDCGSMESVNLYRSTVNSIEISRCALNNFRPRSAKIGTLKINNSSIANSRFDGMNVKSIIIDNVILNGDLDFSGAQTVENKMTRITKQPGLNLNTTGSNIHF